MGNLTPMQGSLSKGGFPLPRNFNVRTRKKIYVRKKNRGNRLRATLTLYIAFILFTRVKCTYVGTLKLCDSGNPPVLAQGDP